MALVTIPAPSPEAAPGIAREPRGDVMPVPPGWFVPAYTFTCDGREWTATRYYAFAVPPSVDGLRRPYAVVGLFDAYIAGATSPITFGPEDNATGYATASDGHLYAAHVVQAAAEMWPGAEWRVGGADDVPAVAFTGGVAVAVVMPLREGAKGKPGEGFPKCAACEGIGKVDTCTTCGGDGDYECDCCHCEGHDCEDCDGTGRVGECPACGGSGRRRAAGGAP